MDALVEQGKKLRFLLEGQHEGRGLVLDSLDSHVVVDFLLREEVVRLGHGCVIKFNISDRLV